MSQTPAEPNPTPETPAAKGNRSISSPSTQPPKKRRWGFRFLILILVISLFANFLMYANFEEYFTGANDPIEKFHSGDAFAEKKIAVIRVHGTIMPPMTERILSQIEAAQNDNAVKGVLLSIDSPGGLVADSHQIYHALAKLRTEAEKPIYVTMKRMAASGGYYVAMGAGPEGKIFAEPTTWTGSIGVIIPRYDISGLAANWNIKSVPLKTGKFKDALSPFRELSADERAVWSEILNESFASFLHVIDENRPALTIRKTEKPTAGDDPEVVPNYQELVSANAKDNEKTNLSTGQIFTASTAQKAGLVDEIGFEEDALAELKEKLGLEEVRVVTYQSQVTLWESLLGFGKAQTPEHKQQARLDAAVPQAMYYFSWVPPAIPLP